MSDQKGDDLVPDPKFNKESVPPPEKEIKQTHKGRPDLDYEDTPVGPAAGYVPEGEAKKKEAAKGKH